MPKNNLGKVGGNDSPDGNQTVPPDWQELQEIAAFEMQQARIRSGAHMPALNLDGKCLVDGETFRTPQTVSEEIDGRVNHASIRYHVRKRIEDGEDIPVVRGFNRRGLETDLYPEGELIEGVTHLLNLKVKVGEDGRYVSKRGFEYFTIPALSKKTGIAEQTLRRNFTGESPLKKRPKTIPARDASGKKIILYRAKDIEAEIKVLQEETKSEATLDEKEYCTIDGEVYLTIVACIRDILKDAKKQPKRITVQKRIEGAKLKSKQARKPDGDLVNVYKKTDLESITRVYLEKVRVETEGEKKGIYTDETGKEYALLQTWFDLFEVSEQAFEKGFADTFKGKWPEGSTIEGIDLSNNKTTLYLKNTVETALGYILKAEAIIKDGICLIQQQVQKRVEGAINSDETSQGIPPRVYKTGKKLEADHKDVLRITRTNICRQMLIASEKNTSAGITRKAIDRKKGTEVTVFDVAYALEHFSKS